MTRGLASFLLRTFNGEMPVSTYTFRAQTHRYFNRQRYTCYRKWSSEKNIGVVRKSIFAHLHVHPTETVLGVLSEQARRSKTPALMAKFALNVALALCRFPTS